MTKYRGDGHQETERMTPCAPARKERLCVLGDSAWLPRSAYKAVSELPGQVTRAVASGTKNRRRGTTRGSAGAELFLNSTRDRVGNLIRAVDFVHRASSSSIRTLKASNG